MSIHCPDMISHTSCVLRDGGWNHRMWIAKHQQLRMHTHKEVEMIRGINGIPNERNVTHYTMLLPKALNL